MSEGVAQKSRPVCVLFPTQLRAGRPQASWQPQAPSSPSSRVSCLGVLTPRREPAPFSPSVAGAVPSAGSPGERRTRSVGRGISRGTGGRTRGQRLCTETGAQQKASRSCLCKKPKQTRSPVVPSSAGPLEPRAVQRGLSAHTGPRERPAVLPAALGSEPLSWTPPTLNTSFVNQRSTLHTMGTWRS